MSFRDKQEVPEKAPPLVEEAPPKVCFADGMCDICGKALFDHPEVEGQKKDCHGWALQFRDEPQAVVKEREEAARARVDDRS